VYLPKRTTCHADPLVLHLQLVHDGHLPGRTRLHDSHAHAAQGLRALHEGGGPGRHRARPGRRVRLEAGARRRLPAAVAPHALLGHDRHRLPGGRRHLHRHRAGHRRRALHRVSLALTVCVKPADRPGPVVRQARLAAQRRHLRLRRHVAHQRLHGRQHVRPVRR